MKMILIRMCGLLILMRTMFVAGKTWFIFYIVFIIMMFKLKLHTANRRSFESYGAHVSNKNLSYHHKRLMWNASSNFVNRSAKQIELLKLRDWLILTLTNSGDASFMAPTLPTLWPPCKQSCFCLQNVL